MTPADSNNLAIDVQSLADLRRSARQNSPKAMKESARQFEALFLNMTLKTMRQASLAGDASSGQNLQLYTSMLDQQLSQTLSQRGVGLADYLLRQMTPQALTKPSLPTPPTSTTTTTTTTTTPISAPTTTTTAPMRPRARTPNPQVQKFSAAMAGPAQAAAQKTGLPASFIIGHAALESGWGRHQIVAGDGTPSFNLFGLKAGAQWKGKVAEVLTTEYKDGVAHKVTAQFRAYDSYEQAFDDYAQLLSRSPRYRQVIASGQTVDGFAQGLQQAGYATDPAYAAKLARVIGNTLAT